MPPVKERRSHMDTMTRNHIFMENIDLINRTLHRHRLLLYALHLELDDVYQELAIAALQAIDTYDDGAAIRLPFTSGRNFSMQS